MVYLVCLCVFIHSLFFSYSFEINTVVTTLFTGCWHWRVQRQAGKRGCAVHAP
jgi:hypothetical protein